MQFEWVISFFVLQICCILLEMYSTKNIFYPFPNYPVYYCFAVIYEQRRKVSDVNVMTLIKQSKTMIFISQPHAISHINKCYFHYTIAHDKKNQRADSLFQHQMQRSGDWGCLRKKGRDCLQCFLWSTRNCRVLNFTVEREPEMCR